MNCQHVLLAHGGLVWPCQGPFYRNGQHFHEWPKLSPPREKRESDIVHRSEGRQR